MGRETKSYLMFGVMALALVAVNLFSWHFYGWHEDHVLDVVYLLLAVFALSFSQVRLDRGRLTLSSIAIGASVLRLNPLDVTIVAMAITPTLSGRGPWPIVGNAVMISLAACVAAVLNSYLVWHLHVTGVLSQLAVLALFSGCGWAVVAMTLSIRSGEGIAAIFRHTMSQSLFIAFVYFDLASFLMSYVLNGSILGYFLATIICVLALALTDTIAGRRVRQVLESELSDADRHLFHSRAVEGVVHNLRNHIASAVGYLKEIDLNRLDPVDREAVETASAAANDAVVVLRTLSQGATPRVS